MHTQSHTHTNMTRMQPDKTNKQSIIETSTGELPNQHTQPGKQTRKEQTHKQTHLQTNNTNKQKQKQTTQTKTPRTHDTRTTQQHETQDNT